LYPYTQESKFPFLVTRIFWLSPPSALFLTPFFGLFFKVSGLVLTLASPLNLFSQEVLVVQFKATFPTTRAPPLPLGLSELPCRFFDILSTRPKCGGGFSYSFPVFNPSLFSVAKTDPHGPSHEQRNFPPAFSRPLWDFRTTVPSPLPFFSPHFTPFDFFQPGLFEHRCLLPGLPFFCAVSLSMKPSLLFYDNPQQRVCMTLAGPRSNGIRSCFFVFFPFPLICCFISLSQVMDQLCI